MPQLSHEPSGPKLPRLLAQKEQDLTAFGAFFDAVTELEPDGGLLNLIRKAAKRAGVDYLFEIPGALFGDDNLQACIIRKELGDDLQHGFVVCDEEKGSITLLDYDEVPDRARAFFASYASVLCCLSKFPAVKQLH